VSVKHVRLVPIALLHDTGGQLTASVFRTIPRKLLQVVDGGEMEGEFYERTFRKREFRLFGGAIERVEKSADFENVDNARREFLKKN